MRVIRLKSRKRSEIVTEGCPLCHTIDFAIVRENGRERTPLFRALRKVSLADDRG